MTLWYLIGTLVVLGLALLTVTGTGGPAPALIIWIGRILPAIAALFACIAFCLVVTRVHLGILAAVFFCVPLIALAVLPVLPYVAAARNSNLSLMLTTVAPVLTLFPAMALWHLASASKKRGR
jgi:hypothetical protein